jgi:translation initiation factor 2 subunit 2
MAWKYKYEELLEKAYEDLPEIQKETLRFEIPFIKGNTQGNKTVVTNLPQIATALRRPIEHLMKFLLRELATTGEIKTGQTIFIGKFRSNFLNEKITKYAKEFLFCKQCGKPDTHLKKDSGLTFLVCEACGAKSSVRTLK